MTFYTPTKRYGARGSEHKLPHETQITLGGEAAKAMDVDLHLGDIPAET